MRSRSTSVLLLPLLLAGCACPWLRGRQADPAAVLRAADERLAEMSFAKLTSFPGPRLFDYMNGAAEAYYQRGFRVLASAETKWRTTDARIELYRVDTPANAALLLDDHDDGKGKELPAGAGSASWKSKELEGIFHRQAFFCRVIIYGNDKEAEQLLDALAAAVDQSIAE